MNTSPERELAQADRGAGLGATATDAHALVAAAGGRGAALVICARSLLGTPYHSKGRLPGVGLDCIGVPIVAAWLAGIKPRSFDITGYSDVPDGSLLPECRKHLQPVARADMRPGDVIVVRLGAVPHHVGLLGNYRHGGLSMIHAENDRHRKVVEHRLWFDGAMKFVEAFRIPAPAPGTDWAAA